MGLAGAKNRQKFAKDPNNTKWSRNSDSFGQRILRSHGWEPGQYLGAVDAPHAEWHTDANASHIRVVLRDDNLGLGAKRGRAADECTGLGAFQDLLGRLNGKSDDALALERKAREDVKLSLYMQSKIGSMRFVRGGWLVGDQVKLVENTLAEEDESGAVSATSDSADSETDQKKKKEKRKRKAAELDPASGLAMEGGLSKRRKNETEVEEPSGSESASAAPGAKKFKNPKKRKEKKTADGDGTEPTPVAETEEERQQRKKEKKRRKREMQEAQQSLLGSQEAGVTMIAVKERKKDKKKKKKKREKTEESVGSASDGSEPGSSTAFPSPIVSGTSTPTATQLPSRHLARSRFIAQKRLAVMDAQALNQIFMIKS